MHKGMAKRAKLIMIGTEIKERQWHKDRSDASSHKSEVMYVGSPASRTLQIQKEWSQIISIIHHKLPRPDS